jgi:hypothetical protein
MRLAQLNYRESCRAAFANLQIMTIINLYLFDTLIFDVKNNFNNITCADVTHFYETRSRGTFIRTLNKNRIQPVTRSVTYSGVQLYISLSMEVKNLSFYSFKNKHRAFFIDNPFYSVTE